MEGWQSGLLHQFAKLTGSYGLQGFESLTFLQINRKNNMDKEEIIFLGILLLAGLLGALTTWMTYGWLSAVVHFSMVFVAVSLGYLAGRCQ